MNEYSPSAINRALRRVQEGQTLNHDELVLLISLRGDNLQELMRSAAMLRDMGIRDTIAHLNPSADITSGRLRITYSKKAFIPITHLCRDRCHYCTFVQTPKKLADQNHNLFMEPDEILEIAHNAAKLGCKEVLFTLGDRPEDRWPVAQKWLDARGFNSTVDYVRAMSIMVLENTGLLPHLNPGVLQWEELHKLKPVAASMGMMLETSSMRLFSTKGMAHYGSPDKNPELRKKCLSDAGRLSIPMTTGILVGIGENNDERVQSLHDIAYIQKEYGHIQEVIIQNFRSKAGTAMATVADTNLEEYLATIAVARIILGPKMPVQAPPNLVSLEQCTELIAAGISDFGGISPLTPDHVNPERPWPQIADLADLSAQSGYELTERLTVHPKYIALGSPWIDMRIMPFVRALADPRTGLADEHAIPIGKSWQEPDYSWDDFQISTNAALVGDHSVILGPRHNFSDENWEVVRGKAQEFIGNAQRIDGDVSLALSRAETRPSELSDADYILLANVDGPALEILCHIADQLRQESVGDTVTYIVNRNINFTNICYTGCRFCAFSQRKGDAEAFTLNTEQIAHRAIEAQLLGATEVCMQGGIDPGLPARGYQDIIAAVKDATPDMHVHAYSPMEIINGANKNGSSVADWLIELQLAGLDTIPGTAAEILDDEVRWVLTKGKLPTQSWIDVITTAHSLGIKSSSTMMYGHIDQPHHWVKHLNIIRSIYDEYGGFTEFVPLPFVHHNAPLYLAGASRTGPTIRENRAVHALARIMLHGRINNIQTSWVKLGVRGSQIMLAGGANDLGGTLMEESISRMAGSEHGTMKTATELIEIANSIGRPAHQRLTDYRLIAPTTGTSLGVCVV